jgi:hypothetical protein
MLKVWDRYQNDPLFRAIVDQLTATLMDGQFTPTEMREAAMLAQLKYEDMMPPRPVVFTAEDVWRGKV